MTKFSALLIAAASAVLLAAAAPSSIGTDSAPTAAVESQQHVAAMPDLADQTHIDNGRLRFAQNCAYCHGASGVGGKHRKLQCRNFKPDYVFETITDGLESGSFFMPPWGDAFSAEKRWELVAFIQSLNALDSCS